MPTAGTGVRVGAVVKRLRHPHGSYQLSEFQVLPILPVGSFNVRSLELF
ncbi:MAG TPA: hypothetical protein PLO50_13245 [Nitrospira sp.]|nr:hypothetical protein [Nitrospira sp.]